MKKLKNSLGSATVSAIELVVGILLLVNPINFTSGIIVALGVALAVYGVINIVTYFRTEPAQAAENRTLANGLILLAGGGFCALNSGWFIATFPVLTLIYGVIILVGGLTKLQWMVDILRLKRPRWFFAGISAALSILCGVLIIANPFGTTKFLWIFIGISLIAEAAFDLLSAIFSRAVKEEPVSAGEPSDAS
jgi:uncharacterized membrane protein HdeD (DUF308 family)